MTEYTLQLKSIPRKWEETGEKNERESSGKEMGGMDIRVE